MSTVDRTPHPEPEADFRVPSFYDRCRRKHCHQQPVADMRRVRYDSRGTRDTWWAYCAEHLADYCREVRDGEEVWWVGCGNGAS